MNKKYNLVSFLIDVTMTIASGGLWLFWIAIRETGKNRR